jgi:hypothetical protein
MAVSFFVLPARTATIAALWLAFAACNAGTSIGASALDDGNSTAVDSTPVATVPTTGETAPDPVPAPAVDPRSLCKRGIASARQGNQQLSAADIASIASNVTWWYNWSATPESAATLAAAVEHKVDFVPMVFTAPFNANAIVAGIDANTRYLLGYNEPNFKEQGNLTPAQAARYWPQVEAIADKYGLKIVGPAVNYCGGACNETDPIAWLDAFFAACPNCRVDYIAIHAYVCYGSALTGAYLTPFKSKYTQPIWLTEFSCLDGSADASKLSVQKSYMAQAVALLEADPRIYRYAWFLARSDTASPPLSLLAADGTLSELGSYYLSLPQTCTP